MFFRRRRTLGMSVWRRTEKEILFVFDTRDLSRLKMRAMRSGVWFRALERIDRVLLHLTLRVCDAVRGRALAKS